MGAKDNSLSMDQLQAAVNEIFWSDPEHGERAGRDQDSYELPSPEEADAMAADQADTPWMRPHQGHEGWTVENGRLVRQEPIIPVVEAPPATQDSLLKQLDIEVGPAIIESVGGEGRLSDSDILKATGGGGDSRLSDSDILKATGTGSYVTDDDVRKHVKWRK